jgi:GTP-binding protein
MNDNFNKVSFIKSIVNLKDKPEERLPEVAFAGRSNVGKSSLLNAIFNRKKLVKTSSTPGKTQLLNYFLVNEKFHFVDLPGYGFAKLPKKVSAQWQKMIENYILNSAELKLVCLLIDSRHKLQASDEQMSDWLNYNNIPYLVILTKADKLSKNALNKQLQIFKNIFPDHHIVPFSVHSDVYKTELSSLIRKLIL